MKNSKPALVLLLLGLVAVGGWVVYGLSTDEGRAPAGSGTAQGARVAAASAGQNDGPVVIRARDSARQGASGDAGAQPVATPTSSESAPASAPTASPRREREVRDDSDRSSGWRLGQRRREVEILTSRAADLEARVAQFRADGRDDLADRQQRVADRTRTRVEEMQEDLRDLETAATRDGTLDEAQAGYDEAEPTPSAPARGALPSP